ncbi:MAG: hypothetical protein ACREUC_14135, partial [Steroidobacteraceae bacterium]
MEYLAALAKTLLYGALMSAAGVPLAAAWLRAPAVIGEYATLITRRATALVVLASVMITVL